MVDHTMKKLVGILCDVLVRVASFTFLADFVIIDCEVDFEVPIIMGRPFIINGYALVNMETRKIMFQLNSE